MKRIFQILLYVIFTGQLFACGGSFQYRLFPIGQSENKIILIETSLNRYWGPDTVGATIETRDRWKGTISLIKITKQGNIELIEILDTIDILDRDYSKELKPYFDTAFQIASKLPDFNIANIQNIEFCDFKKDCKMVDLITSTIDKLTIRDNEGNDFEIKIPNIIVENSEFSGGMGNQDFKINSIRKLTIGKNELTIIDFASGEEHNTNINKQKENQKQCGNIEDCIYKEITLYHGLAFDAIIWK
jgi:hypothetical protein